MCDTQAQWTVDEPGDARVSGYPVKDTDGDLRAQFMVRHDAENYARDRNRAAGIAAEVGDAHGEIEQAMRGTLDDLRVVVRAADGAEDLSYGEIVNLAALGVGDEPPAGEEACDLRSEADEHLYELPLSVERTVSFEIVLGTGGPHREIVVECATFDYTHTEGPVPGTRGSGVTTTSYEIRRVLFRYAWTGVAERELYGDDRETAEAFARRVVPELVE